MSDSLLSAILRARLLWYANYGWYCNICRKQLIVEESTWDRDTYLAIVNNSINKRAEQLKRHYLDEHPNETTIEVLKS